MTAWTYTLFPLFALIGGAAASAAWTPAKSIQSALQHFAAGVVFAAAAGELLPDLKHQGHTLWVAVGGGLGVATMLGVKAVSARMHGASSFAIVTAIDVLIDGVVLGIAFVAGMKAGMLLTVALTLEMLSLGISVALARKEAGRSGGSVVAIAAGIGVLLPMGALLGSFAGTLSPRYLAALFAFALVAMLYLVTEELLVEAHEHAETPLASALFFVGFLLVLVLEEQMS